MFQVGSDNQRGVIGMKRQELGDNRALGGRGGGQPEAFLVRARCILQALTLGKLQTNLHTGCRGDVTLGFELLPGDVKAFGSDQAEDVTFSPVLPDQGGGEAEASAGLELGGELKHGSGQEVHLVIDHEPPVFGVQDSQVSELSLALCRHDAVAGDRDRLDLFDAAGILTDVVFGE